MKIFLTAPPGLGKSTVVSSVVRRFPGNKCGVFAREILDGMGKRIGFTSINASGHSKQFMFIAAVIGGGSIDGVYDVDVAAIDDFVVPELRKGLQDAYSLVYVDEIGKAQAQSPAFLGVVEELINSNRDVMGTILSEPESWSMRFRQGRGLCVIEVTAANRDALPEILLAAFASSAQFGTLTAVQQQGVFDLLQQLLALQQFESARKLFANAVGYVAEGKVQQVGRTGAVTTWSVIGKTDSHKVMLGQAGTFTCDCHLHNGTGPYAGRAQICSHELSVRLLSLDTACGAK